MTSPTPTPSSSAQLATVALALAAVALTVFAATNTSWFVAQAADGGDFAVGLVSAKMCVSGECHLTSLSSFDGAGQAPRLGIAVLLATAVAGLLLLAAVGRRMIGRGSGSASLPRAALAASIFAAALAGAWLLTSPWSGSMVPGTAAIVFFVGAGLAAATASVPLGALRRA